VVLSMCPGEVDEKGSFGKYLKNPIILWDFFRPNFFVTYIYFTQLFRCSTTRRYQDDAVDVFWWPELNYFEFNEIEF